MPWTSLNLLKQQCFSFSVKHFGSPQVTKKLCHALCGDATVYDHASLKQNGMTTALELFEICIRHESLFEVFRHNLETAFKTVNDEWDPYIELSPAETQQIVTAYMMARNTCCARRRPGEKTKLANAVNGFETIWSRLTRKVLLETSEPGFKPPQQLQLLLRQLSWGSVTTFNDISPTSVSYDGNYATESPWPPAIFSPEELWFLVDSRTRNDVAGISFANRPGHPNLCIHSMDVNDIKRFLCTVALTYCNPPKNSFALFMTPIGFLDSLDKSRAFQETKGRFKPKVYGTVDEFINFAQIMLHEHNRRMVMGLLTNVAHDVGNVLIIRQKGVDQGMQLVLCDPSQLARTGLQMGKYQAAVMDKIIGGPIGGITEAWWGGFPGGESAGCIDPVEVASDFLHNLVSNPMFEQLFVQLLGEGQDVAMRQTGFHKLAVQQ